MAGVLAAHDVSVRNDTDWLLLDCELMPWSAKAQEFRQQYAAVGAMQTLARVCAADVSSDVSVAEAANWWEDLTAAGGEGMVV